MRKLTKLFYCTMLTASMAMPYAAYAAEDNAAYTVYQNGSSSVYDDNAETEAVPDEPIDFANPNLEAQTAASGLGESLGMFKLTAYCLCSKCNGNNDKVARIGTPLVPYHTVAVDPRVIPLGTWLYINIPGQGWQKFRAEDTGSHIKNHRIDICLPEHNMCNNPIYNSTCEVRIALD